MNPEELIPFLKKCELTQNLSEAEMKELVPFIVEKPVEKGQLIFKEGDESRELYIVKSGQLEVFKHIEEYEEYQGFDNLKEGAFFGEMAHLEDEKRSASVKTIENSELLVINLDNLQKDESKQFLYSKILAQLGKKVSQNLRKTDKTVIESLKEKLKFMQAHNQISKTLIHLVVLITIWFNLSVIVKLFPTYRQALDLIFTSSLLILFALSMLYVIRSSGYPLSFYGLTWNRWFANAIEAILYSIPIMAFFIGLKWILVENVEMFKGIHIFSSLEHLKSSFVLAILYIVLSPVQELIARGGIQSTFRNFFQGPNRVFYAILVSNLLFQMLHTVKDFWLALASLFLGFLWGFLFEKQKSLVGVSVSHALIGTWAFFILDYDTLFQIAAARG